MKRLLDALCSPYHVVLTVLVAWFGPVILAGEALGFWQPDYRRLVMVVIVSYWATVICELGFFGRQRNGS
jgi:hypothetical protein